MTEERYNKLVENLTIFYRRNDVTREEAARAMAFLADLERGPEETAATVQPQSRAKRSPSRGGLGGGLKKAVAQGPATLQVIVERLRADGRRLPKDDNDACAFVLKLLKKSPRVYREYPDGTWGLLRPIPITSSARVA